MDLKSQQNPLKASKDKNQEIVLLDMKIVG